MAKKKVHRFGEVCRLLDVQPYVLRYWETEFPALAGDDAGGAQRTYTDEDLAVVQRIKELLYSESFTLVGAKKKLQAELDEGKLKLSTGAGAEEAVEVEAAAEPEAEEEVEERTAKAEKETEPQQAEEKAPRKKAASSKKKVTKKQKAAKPAEANVDDSDGEAPSAETSNLDLGELKAILGDARELLKQLQA